MTVKASAQTATDTPAYTAELVTAAVGVAVGAVVVGAAVGAEVVGAPVVGDVVGAGVVGDAVGAEVVGVAVGDSVEGAGVVGDVVGAPVVGDVVGATVVGVAVVGGAVATAKAAVDMPGCHWLWSSKASPLQITLIAAVTAGAVQLKVVWVFTAPLV